MIFWPLMPGLWLALAGWPFLMPRKEVMPDTGLSEQHTTPPPVTDAGGTILQFPRRR